MSFLDKARRAAYQARTKAAQVAAERGDTIRTGIDKAGQAVDRRTGGKYRDQIQKAKGVADTRLTGLAAQHAEETRQDPVSAEARVVGDDEGRVASRAAAALGGGGQRELPGAGPPGVSPSGRGAPGETPPGAVPP